MSRFIGIVSAYAYAVSQGYTGTEEEYAELMASYATVAEEAAESAESASASATSASASASTATTKASEASQSATQAGTKASQASTSATQASASATSASQSAQTATTKASEASVSASTASTKAGEASTSATTASNKASEASASATSAQTAKDDAVSAKTAAQTAQAGAETAAASVSASAEQIATNAEDISQLKSDLNQKANVDGSYENLTAGNAEQLVSTVFVEDSTPYNFRTTGGSADVGDRLYDEIVGASAAVNQLAKALVDGNYNKGLGTAVYDNGTVSFTAWERYAAFYGTTIKELVEYHKYLISAKIKTTSQPSTNTVRLGVGNSGYNQGVIYVPSTASVTSFTEISGVVQYSYGTSPTNNYLFLQDNRAEVSQIDMKDLMLFDLTAMFGTTIADYVYTLETATATAGAGVAWLKAHFPCIFDAGYIPYNAGELVSVSGLSEHKMTGFNQFDKSTISVGYYIDNADGVAKAHAASKASAYIPVVPNTSYYISSEQSQGTWGAWYDANKSYISGITEYHDVSTNKVKTAPANAHYMRLTLVYNGSGNPDTFCVNLHWDGEKDGQYEPYKKWSYPLDSDVVLRGLYKLDASNNLYADGDVYSSDGTVTRRYGIVDLGTLNWSKTTSYDYPVFYAGVDGKAQGETSCVCDRYPYVGSFGGVSSFLSDGTDKSIGSSSLNTQIYVRDDSYTDPAAFKTAMSGVYFVYPLATSTTEEADPYISPQICDDFGTEEYVSTTLISVGHNTKYANNLRAKLEMAPDSPEGNGDYIVRQTSGTNEYVTLASTQTIQDIIARLEALEGGNA